MVGSPKYFLPKEQEWLNAWHPKNPVISKARFLSDDIPGKMPTSGALILGQAPMGIGKSYWTKKEVIDRVLAERPTARIVSITPTRSIGKSQASEWGIIQRDDIPGKEKSMADKIASTPHVSMPWDSVRHIPAKVDVLIIDEAESGLNNVMFGSTIKGNGGRDLCLRKLKELAQNPDILIVVLDANLTNPTAKFFASLNPALPVHSFKSERKPLSWNVDLYANSRVDKNTGYKKVHTRILKHLDDGDNIAIAVDSQAEAAALTKVIRRDYKDIQVIEIDSSTTNKLETKKLLADINNGIVKSSSGKQTVLIYSPSLGQGVSITLTEEYAANPVKAIEEQWEALTPFFKAVIALNFHLPTFQFRQMLGRIRHAVPRTVWVNTDTGDANAGDYVKPEDVMGNVFDETEVILELIKQAQKVSRKADPDDVCKTLTAIISNRHQDDVLTAYSELKARENYNQSYRGEEMYRQLTESGHTVKVLTGGEDSELSEKVKDEKDEVKQLKAKAVATVSIKGLDLETLTQVENKDYKQKCQQERIIFENIYPELADSFDTKEEFEAFYLEMQILDDGRWLRSIENDFLLQNPDKITEKRIKELEYFSKRYQEHGIANLHDLKKLNLKLEFILKHDLKTKLFSKEQWRNDDPELMKIFEPLMKGRDSKKMKEFFGINVKAKRKNLVTWASKILETFGYSTKQISESKEKSKGKRTTVREYRIVRKNEQYQPLVMSSLEKRYAQQDEEKVVEVFDISNECRSRFRIEAASRVCRVWGDRAAIIGVLNEYELYPSDLVGEFTEQEYSDLVEILGDWVDVCHTNNLSNEKENQSLQEAEYLEIEELFADDSNSLTQQNISEILHK
jgi:hypothetical protein